MKPFPLLSLRTSLLLLVFVSLLPALVMLLFTANMQRQHALSDIEENALVIAYDASSQLDLLIQDVHQFLFTLANIPQIQFTEEPSSCTPFVRELMQNYPHYSGLEIISPDGKVFCSTDPGRYLMDVSNSGYFQRAVQKGDFSGGNYVLDANTGKPLLVFADPIYDAGGKLEGVISVELDLNWLNQFSKEKSIPEGANVTLVDIEDKRILARYPDEAAWAGKPLPDSSIYRAILDGVSTAVLPSLDGISRLFAFVRLQSAPNLYFLVGIPEEIAVSPVNQLLLHNLLGLLAVAVVAFGLAWVVGDFLLLRRLKALNEAAQRLAEGDLGARTGLGHKRNELDQLAHTFDHMAETLQDRDLQLRELMESYRSLFDSVPVGLYRSLPDGTILDVNLALVEMLGYSDRSVVLAKNAAEFYANPEDRRQWISQLEQNGTSVGAEVRFRRKDGELIWARLNTRPVLGPDGEVQYYDGSMEDVTSRKLTEFALNLANEQLKGWVDRLEDRNRQISLLNQMAEALQMCHTFDEAFDVVSRFVRALFPGLSGSLYVPNDSTGLLQAVVKWGEVSGVLSHEKVFAPEECWALHYQQKYLADSAASKPQCGFWDQEAPDYYMCLPLAAPDDILGLLQLRRVSPASTEEWSEETGLKAYKSQITDSQRKLAVAVTDQITLALSNIKLRETLHNQSIRDPLTNLFNRRYLEETLEREVHRALRKRRPLVLIMLDIDNFKEYNDTFGHLAGDAVLRAAAKFMKNTIRGEDFVCRYGGEEFVLVLPELSLEAARQRAEELRTGIKELEVYYGERLMGHITMSIGVASLERDTSSADELLKAADVALYHAKKKGRDCVVVYAP